MGEYRLKGLDEYDMWKAKASFGQKVKFYALCFGPVLLAILAGFLLF